MSALSKSEKKAIHDEAAVAIEHAADVQAMLQQVALKIGRGQPLSYVEKTLALNAMAAMTNIVMKEPVTKYMAARNARADADKLNPAFEALISGEKLIELCINDLGKGKARKTGGAA